MTCQVKILLFNIFSRKNKMTYMYHSQAVKVMIMKVTANYNVQ